MKNMCVKRFKEEVATLLLCKFGLGECFREKNGMRPLRGNVRVVRCRRPVALCARGQKHAGARVPPRLP